VIVAAAAAVAALSLTLMRTPDFDPTAWLIWGEQLSHGELHTLAGPSWKPLPVLFTTPFAFAGDTGAEWLWLVVARTGGLLAVAMAYAVGRRLGGRAAGLIAAAGLALATAFLYDAARGDAEGVLVLAGLGAVHLHLSGRREAALLAGVAAGLIRPEVWPLLALYGLDLVRVRRDTRSVVLVGSLGAVVLASWLVPEHVGSGEWLRAATRAQHPASGSPGQSSFPFGATLVNSAVAVPWPLYAGAIAAVLGAWRSRDRVVLTLAAAATFLMALVAVMAEFGFTGNLRYVTLPAALVCVLGGVGLSGLVDRRRGAPLYAAGALAVAAILGSLYLLGRDAQRLADDGRIFGRELPQVIARTGGVEALERCGQIGADHFSTQIIARRLSLRQQDVLRGIDVPSGTVFATLGTGAADYEPLPVRFRLGNWVLRSTCPLGADGGPDAAGPPSSSGG
jgi:hypothetical protein